MADNKIKYILLVLTVVLVSIIILLLYHNHYLRKLQHMPPAPVEHTVNGEPAGLNNSPTILQNEDEAEEAAPEEVEEEDIYKEIERQINKSREEYLRKKEALSGTENTLAESEATKQVEPEDQSLSDKVDEEREVERMRLEREKQYYLKDVADTREIILKSTGNCRSVLNVYAEIWQSAINRRLDFSSALHDQKEEFELDGVLDEMIAEQKEVSSVMEKLSEPPEGCAEIYQELLKLFGIYSEYWTLAMSPSGSMVSFNQRRNDLWGEIIRSASQLKVMLPREYSNRLIDLTSDTE